MEKKESINLLFLNCLTQDDFQRTNERITENIFTYDNEIIKFNKNKLKVKRTF